MRMTLENNGNEAQTPDGGKEQEGFASRVNEDAKGHWKDLEGQGFKVHWDYFWSYYHIHVIVIAAVLVFVIALVREIASQKPYALNAICINIGDYADAVPSISLIDDSTDDRFAEFAGIDTGEYVVSIDITTTLSRDNPSTMDMTVSQKILALVASTDLDAMAADRDLFISYARSQIFADLREVMEPQELSAYEEQDKVFYIDRAEIEAYDSYTKEGSIDEPFVWNEVGPEEMEEPVPVGLWIKRGGSGKEALCGVIVNSKRTDAAVDFLRFLMLQ